MPRIASGETARAASSDRHRPRAAPAAAHPGVDPVPFADRSRFAAKLARGEMVSSVEIVPPRGVDPSKMLSDVAALKRAGVDAVNVPDGPRAQSRMGAIMTSLLIEQQVGIETVTHYCCRDRNLLGMLSDLLGAAAMGLRNILLITGDPAEDGTVSRRDGGLRHRRDRADEPGAAAESRPRPRRQPDRRADAFAIGVGVNPARLDLGARAPAVRVESGGRAPSTR